MTTLVATSLSKSFGGVSSVVDASIELKPGAITALTGSNGAGKTTFVNLLSGHLSPDIGKIYLSGKEITPKSARQRAKDGIYRSFQNTRLYENLTVGHNILIAHPLRIDYSYRSLFLPVGSSTEEKKYLSVALEYLRDLTNNQCLELTSFLDKPVQELSIGQRRMVELISLLASKPKVLLLDEPSAGLDELVHARFCESLRICASKGTAVLIVSHDLEFLDDIATEQYHLTRGCLRKVL